MFFILSFFLFDFPVYIDLAVYSFPAAAIKKYCILGGLDNRNTLPHSSAGKTSKTKLLVGLVSPKAIKQRSSMPLPWLLAGCWQSLVFLGL